MPPGFSLFSRHATGLAALPLAQTIREHEPTLTPTLSLSEGEGGVSKPSPPEGERDRVRGRVGREEREERVHE
jgi:hypothetical protein